MTKEEKNKILADKNSASNTTAASAQQTSLSGVDKQYTDKVNSTFTTSDAQTKAQGKVSNQGLVTQNLLNQDKIISNKTQAAIKSKFSTPKAVTEADAYLKGQLSKIQNGKTSYSDQINSLMSQISGRDKFSYDVDNDPLFQQALASAMNSGKSAMQDTIGQASALTGGYGSSYATTAGNQAYNAYIEDAYNNLPQYYQMALDAYNAEGDEMYRQLGMYQTADETEYGRMLNAYDTTGAYRDRLYNEAYQQFRDNKSDAFASANLQLNEYGQLADNALALYDMYANEADKMYEREYQQWSDEVNKAMQYAQMLNSDYWKQTQFDEEIRQYEQSFAEEQRQFDEKLAHDSAENALNREHQTTENALDREHQSSENQLNREHQSNENLLDREHQSNENLLDRTWKSEEADKDRQHAINMQEDAQSFTASENAKDRATKTYSGGSGENGGFSLTTAQMNAARKAFDNAGGGEDGFEAACAELEALGVTVDTAGATTLRNALLGGTPVGGSGATVTAPSKTGTIKGFSSKENDNFDIEINGEEYRVENHGKVTDTNTLNELKNIKVKNGKAFVYDGQLYVKESDNYYKVGATNILWGKTSGYKNVFGALIEEK